MHLDMINTVVHAIEEFEPSHAFEESQLPRSIFANGGDDDYNVEVETEDDTSDGSDEYKDVWESSSSDDTKIPVSFQELIKQTLKDKIRIRRESAGAAKITNVFEPPRQYKLTPEEERKNEIRKQRNRRSANKSRLQRIERGKKLENEAVKLEEEHAKRTAEVNVLTKIKQALMNNLQLHLQSCPRLGTPSTRSVLTDSHSSPSLNCRAKLVNSNQANNKSAHVYSEGQLVAPLGESEICHEQQSAPLLWSLKRKADHQGNEQLSKIPKIMNQPMISDTSQPGLTACSASSTSQSYTNHVVSEVWLRNSLVNNTNSVQSSPMASANETQCNTVKSNMLRGVPNAVGNSQHPIQVLPVTNDTDHCDSTAVNSVSCISTGGKVNATSGGMHSNITDKQMIDLIKKHLLDGFTTVYAPSLCIDTTINKV